MKALSRILAGTLALAAMTGLAEAQEKWAKIRIGTEGAYPPFNFFDANRELQGFEIDLAKAVCEKMQAECEFVAQDWDGMIPGLMAGKYDAIAASMSITDERKQVIDFSDKYYQTPSAFIVDKDNAEMDVSPEGMDGKIIGAQSSTIQANYLEENYGDAEIRLYPTQDEVYLDLASGRIDALMVDKAVGLDWLENKEDGQCCQFVGEDVPIGGGVGFGLRKEDQDLKAKLNEAIAAIREDGTYQKINEKYYPFSIY